MPDSLAPILTTAERKAAADKLWRIIGLCDARAPLWQIREAVELTVREIEPFMAEYPRDRPMNLEAHDGLR